MSEENKPLMTPVATLSYPHLAKPQPADSEDPNAKDKYSATFVFAKADDLKVLEAAARAVAIKALGEKKGSVFPLFGGKGSAFRTDNAHKYPKIEGAITISARSADKPGTVLRTPEPGSQSEKRPNGVPAKVPQDGIVEVFYPGAKVKGHVAPFWYDKKTNKGISWALNNIQKWAEGERLDNRVAAEDAFDADMSEVPASLDDIK